MKRSINIGMFGLGTVGLEVLKIIEDKKNRFFELSNFNVVVTKAVVSNIKKDRGIDLSKIDLSNDPDFILDDDNIDIVIELIGDIDNSFKIITSALSKGKHVLTANKAVLAQKGDVIFNAAYDSKTILGFESSVGSGIPILKSIKEGFSADIISSFAGILNSTSNYMLTKMFQDKSSFTSILKEAQNKGYAEPDATFDIDGYDAAHKLIILMNLSFNKLFSYDSLFFEGISNINEKDIAFAEYLGYKIKHLCWAECENNRYYAGAHPILIPKDSLFYLTEDTFNCIKVQTLNGGPFTFTGLGAGSKEAASGVISDLVETLRFISTKQENAIYPLSVNKEKLTKKEIEPFEDTKFKYYLRLTVSEKIGVLGQITTKLGEYNISINTIYQKEDDCDTSVTILIITNETCEKNIKEALKTLTVYDFMLDDPYLIRIKDSLI